jgi:hypothetical protein
MNRILSWIETPELNRSTGLPKNVCALDLAVNEIVPLFPVA